MDFPAKGPLEQWGEDLLMSFQSPRAIRERFAIYGGAKFLHCAVEIEH
jgi:hypothetical protein